MVDLVAWESHQPRDCALGESLVFRTRGSADDAKERMQPSGESSPDRSYVARNESRSKKCPAPGANGFLAWRETQRVA
jgi:hypothetical protein